MVGLASRSSSLAARAGTGKVELWKIVFLLSVILFLPQASRSLNIPLALASMLTMTADCGLDSVVLCKSNIFSLSNHGTPPLGRSDAAMAGSHSLETYAWIDFL
ncbi:hypothetical protein N7G274_003494 [Stereocaulon virgatum]|uniref:Uncharacterized protein n=1 Tax=Stereocaulon virgatum TaxID=373712 RepID=A0ABR4AES6_9LECA